MNRTLSIRERFTIPQDEKVNQNEERKIKINRDCLYFFYDSYFFDEFPCRFFELVSMVP